MAYTYVHPYYTILITCGIDGRERFRLNKNMKITTSKCSQRRLKKKKKNRVR